MGAPDGPVTIGVAERRAAEAAAPAAPAAPVEITDVIGRTRPVVHSWPDGSWECPFSHSGVNVRRDLCAGPGASGYRGGACGKVHCHAPGCVANPHYPPDRARADVVEAERREKEEAQRKRDREWAARRAEEDRQTREEQRKEIRQEAEARGACVRCALKDAPFRTKFVKHRKPGACPLSR